MTLNIKQLGHLCKMLNNRLPEHILLGWFVALCKICKKTFSCESDNRAVGSNFELVRFLHDL